MANSTADGRPLSTQLPFCAATLAQGLFQNVFFAALNTLLSIAAVLGNVLILVALQKESSLHPPSKLFFRCLACTDLCVGLIPQPFYVVYLLALTKENWSLCQFSFALATLTGMMFSGVSLFTLTAISVDRLLALLLRMRYRQVVTLKRVRMLVVVTWFSGGIIPSTLIFDATVAGRLVSTLLLLCMVTSTFCYVKMYHTLRRHHIQVHEHVQQPQPHGGAIGPLNMTRYRKTVSTALWLQMTLLACYFPYCVAITVAASLDRPLGSKIAFILTITPIFLNSSLNPILYCWKIREVRQAVKDTIKQLFFFL